MSITTEWMWTQIDKSFDTQYDATTMYGRYNWRLARERKTNADFVSQLGETAASLTAKNGPFERTVSVSEELTMLSFLTSFDFPLEITASGSDYGPLNGAYRLNGALSYKNKINTNTIYDAGTYWYTGPGYYRHVAVDAFFPWDSSWMVAAGGYTSPPSVASAGIYPAANGVLWAQAGTRNSYPVYIESGNTATDVFIVWFSSTAGKLVCAEVPFTELIADTFDDDHTTYGNRFSATTTATNINGVVFTGEGKLASIGSMTAIASAVESVLRCISDSPVFENKHSGFYTQSQVWERKSPYVALN